MKKKKEDRILDEAATLAGAWLAKFGFELSETLNEFGNNVKMEISPAAGVENGSVMMIMKGYTVGMRNRLGFDWAGSPKSRYDAWMYVLCLFFQEEEHATGNIVHGIQIDSSDFGAKGYRKIERRTYKVPKFRFRSVEEFVLKATASPDFAEVGRGG